MRKFLFVFWLLFSINVMSQEEPKIKIPKPEKSVPGPLFRVWDSDGKEGFIDLDGNAVSRPREEVRDFHEGAGFIWVKGRLNVNGYLLENC